MTIIDPSVQVRTNNEINEPPPSYEEAVIAKQAQTNPAWLALTTTTPAWLAHLALWSEQAWNLGSIRLVNLFTMLRNLLLN